MKAVFKNETLHMLSKQFGLFIWWPTINICSHHTLYFSDGDILLVWQLTSDADWTDFVIAVFSYLSVTILSCRKSYQAKNCPFLFCGVRLLVLLLQIWKKSIVSYFKILYTSSYETVEWINFLLW